MSDHEPRWLLRGQLWHGRKPLQRLAWRLRCIADRIDPLYAPRSMSYTFTFEDGEGIRFRDDQRGCRLWYLGEPDYVHAHSDADSATAYASRWIPMSGEQP